MSKGEIKEAVRPVARSHDQYGLFTIISIFLPLIGLLLGVVYVTHKNPTDRKLGEHAIALSLLFGLIWFSVLSVLNPFRPVSSPVIPVATNPQGSTAVVTSPQTTVGSALTLDASKITVQKIIDPVTAQTSADSGTHFIAVQLQITNVGTGTLTGDVNNNVTVIRSDNQSATVSFISTNACTNFNQGTYSITAGASATGCVFFQIPDGLTVSKIQYNEMAGFSGQTGEWTAQ